VARSMTAEPVGRDARKPSSTAPSAGNRHLQRFVATDAPSPPCGCTARSPRDAAAPPAVTSFSRAAVAVVLQRPRDGWRTWSPAVSPGVRRAAPMPGRPGLADARTLAGGRERRLDQPTGTVPARGPGATDRLEVTEPTGASPSCRCAVTPVTGAGTSTEVRAYRTA
jgi:hypothetical protein